MNRIKDTVEEIKENQMFYSDAIKIAFMALNKIAGGGANPSSEAVRAIYAINLIIPDALLKKDRCQ